MYKLGESVIVTERNKDKSEKHQVGVVIKQRTIKKQPFYDILLESRSAWIMLNTARSNRTFINRTLSEKLCESGDIVTTVPYKYLVDAELLPFIDA
tara:strand:- start:2477 stop:2764 length:288 start_codon:yes stop_codon:yes gene_type:complete